MKSPINLSFSRAESDARTVTLFTEVLDRCLEAERHAWHEARRRDRTTLIEAFRDTLARATELANKFTEISNLTPPAPMVVSQVPCVNCESIMDVEPKAAIGMLAEHPTTWETPGVAYDSDFDRIVTLCRDYKRQQSQKD